MRNRQAAEKLGALIVPMVLALVAGCGDEGVEALASARRVSGRADLIGGNAALGEMGDYLLENDQIRLVIQGPGYSRGFGVFGGSLIDADLRRPSEVGDSQGGTGNDSFGELFPAFFLEAVATDNVEILADGSDGGPARIRVSGYAGDFLTLVGLLNRAATGSHTRYQDAESDPRLRYENIYELAPGERYVTITFRTTNLSDQALTFPSSDATALLTLLGLDLEGFTLPLVDIALFGDTSPVFAPGIGYDVRTELDRAFAREVEWPAFPGILTDWVASRGSAADVSYGFLAAESDRNFVYNKRAFYDDGRTPITRSSLLIPFVATSLMGIFHNDAPGELGPGESFEVTRYFIVGSGDVGSVVDVINRIQGVPVGRLGGLVLDAVSGQPAEDAQVLVYQRLEGGDRRIYSQYDVEPGGHFTGTLAPGEYSLRVQGLGRPLTDFTDVTIRSGRTTAVVLGANSPGRIAATVVDVHGRRLPAKITVVGSYDGAYSGQDPRGFLFDLQAGEEFRWSDLVRDFPDDASTRRYIEAVEPTHNGSAEVLVRPGDYTVYVSRGPEYDVVRGEVSVGAGQTVTVAATLERVVDTTGWMAADLHMHCMNSIDSGMEMDRRVRWIAAEGVEWAVASDHNYITDYAPYIARNDLESWVTSSVGLELSTLEAGHFNGYPLRYEVGPITHGSFEWSERPPQELFDELRRMGAYGPENTIVQVNHPRDTIQGYFESYGRDALTGEYAPPGPLSAFISSSGPAFFDEEGRSTFSFDFEALEVVTGKRLELIHHYRVPEELPEGEIPEDPDPAGTILLDSEGEVAYPGAVDDWYNLLNLGYRFVAVGNSDSHEDYEEIGFPRTMIHVGTDDPMAVSELQLVDGLRSRRVFVTTAPMVDFFVNDPSTGGMGQTLVDGDGVVSLTVELRAAPWVSVGRINVIRNGVLADSVLIDEGRDLAANPLVETIDVALATDRDDNPIDSWYVIEVIGYQSLFPMALPLEVPPLVLSDAVASLGSSFGFLGDEYGDLHPPREFPVVAYALTNPVWVTVDDGPFDPPGTVPYIVRSGEAQDPGLEVMPGRRIVADVPVPSEGVRYVGAATPIRERPRLVFERDRNNPYDVRRIFDAFGHGH